MDVIEQFKAKAREGWSGFAPFEMLTASVAPDLVRFAQISAGQKVLDVGCGTGVVAITAARLEAVVTGADLTPALLDRARENATLAGVPVDFHEADVEALPFADSEFDTVVSQFGHMFGPRPDVTLSEMLRVLKPGGTIAFSTWPPELYTGKMFALVGKYAPPPPAGVSPPGAWGEPGIVTERFGDAVEALRFDRGTLMFPSLSAAHARVFLELNAGPVTKLVEALEADAAKLNQFRTELEALIDEYLDRNIVHQDFLMSRAIKR